LTPKATSHKPNPAKHPQLCFRPTIEPTPETEIDPRDYIFPQIECLLHPISRSSPVTDPYVTWTV
jgi:hypothetical protein